MKKTTEKSSLVIVLLLSFIVISFLAIPAQASNPSRRTTSTTTTSTTTVSTTTPPSNSFIKIYSNFITKTTQQKDVTPEDVQGTSDGGYIFLASTDCTTQACVSAQGGANDLVSWVVRTDSSGNPLWQKEVGCFSNPPGDYSLGVSIQQTADGGYVFGGGTIGCGSGSILRTNHLDSRREI